MFKKILLLACILFSNTSLLADELSYVSGKIKFDKIQTEGENGILVIPLGKLGIGKLNLFHELKNDRHLINGNAEFKNPTNKPLYLVYYLSLRNRKDQLIASTSGDLEISQSGNIHQYASALMYLTKEKIDEISDYEIVLYESDKPIGFSEPQPTR